MNRIEDALAQRFPNAPVARQYYFALLSEFLQSGLAPSNLITDVATSDEGQLWSHVWEARLYRHLKALGFKFHPGRQRGPDFGIIHNGLTIWIEAVVPSPQGIPAEWLAPPPRYGEPMQVKSMPHEQMLLRWTAVLRDKRNKLAGYLADGIISPTEPTVIAINGCRLYEFAMHDNGISQRPFAIEAVFPVGPLAVPISLDGSPPGEAQNVMRYTISKPSGATVPTTSFLSPDYAHVSAIVGCVKMHTEDGSLPLTVVHNPLATTALPRGITGATREYVADEVGDAYTVRALNESP